MAPSYFKFTKDLKDQNVKFVDCPVTPTNGDLHASLGVNSIPFVHVYHPNAGLVEERKVSRRYYSGFEQAVKTYFQDSCDLPLPPQDSNSGSGHPNEEEDADAILYSSPWDVKELATGTTV